MTEKARIIVCDDEEPMREMLEELSVSAMNDALHKSKQAAAEAMQEVTGGLNIPGMEGMMSKLGLGPSS